MTNVGNYPARKITLRGTFANFGNFRRKKGGKPPKIGALGKSHAKYPKGPEEGP
jgi:hypothetical protein